MTASSSMNGGTALGRSLPGSGPGRVPRRVEGRGRPEGRLQVREVGRILSVGQRHQTQPGESRAGVSPAVHAGLRATRIPRIDVADQRDWRPLVAST